MVTELDVLISVGSCGPQITGQVAAPNDQGQAATISMAGEAIIATKGTHGGGS